MALKKRWVWSGAKESRHQHLSGETRDPYEPFSNGLQYPGDPAGSDAETANCKCGLHIFEVDDVTGKKVGEIAKNLSRSMKRDLAKTQTEKAAAKVSTDDELTRALEYYHSPASFKLNETLRNGNELRELDMQIVKKLDGAMVPSAKPSTVYRGIPDIDEVFGEGADDFTGLRWSQQSYMSTSSQFETARVFAEDVLTGIKNPRPAILRIDLPEGTPQLRIDATDFGAQQEVLLPRNMQLEIYHIQYPIDGSTPILHARAVLRTEADRDWGVEVSGWNAEGELVQETGRGFSELDAVNEAVQRGGIVEVGDSYVFQRPGAGSQKVILSEAEKRSAGKVAESQSSPKDIDQRFAEAANGKEAVSRATWDGQKIPLETRHGILGYERVEGKLDYSKPIYGDIQRISKHAELVLRYRTNNYKITNKKLRQGITDPKRVPSMPALDAEMVPVSEDVVLHRVIQQKFGYHEAEVGSTFTDAAYTYTSSRRDLLDNIVSDTHLVTGKPTFVRILAPKGTKVMNMGKVGYTDEEFGTLSWTGLDSGAYSYYDASAEIVMARNTTLRMVRKTKREDGLWEIDMEVVPAAEAPAAEAASTVSKSWMEMHSSNIDVTTPNASITKKHLRELELIPNHIGSELASKGVKWFIGAKSVPNLDGMGYLKDIQPRGWPAGSTWNEVAGAYNSTNNYVLAGQGNTGSTSLLLHETGHAIGEKIHIGSGTGTKLNNSQPLKSHHSRLYNNGRLTDYFKQGGPGGEAGRQELLAEGFAHYILRGHAGVTKRWDSQYADWLRDTLKLEA